MSDNKHLTKEFLNEIIKEELENLSEEELKEFVGALGAAAKAAKDAGVSAFQGARAKKNALKVMKKYLPKIDKLRTQFLNTRKKFRSDFNKQNKQVQALIPMKDLSKAAGTAQAQMNAVSKSLKAGPQAAAPATAATTTQQPAASGAGEATTPAPGSPQNPTQQQTQMRARRAQRKLAAGKPLTSGEQKAIDAVGGANAAAPAAPAAPAEPTTTAAPAAPAAPAAEPAAPAAASGGVPQPSPGQQTRQRITQREKDAVERAKAADTKARLQAKRAAANAPAAANTNQSAQSGSRAKRGPKAQAALDQKRLARRQARAATRQEHIQKIMKVLKEAFDQNKKLRIIKNGK